VPRRSKLAIGRLTLRSPGRAGTRLAGRARRRSAPLEPVRQAATNPGHMTDFAKHGGHMLRELAGHACAAEAAMMLETLASSFAQWRSGAILPSELLRRVHAFHRDQSRGRWSMCQGLQECDIVARKPARGACPARMRRARTKIQDRVTVRFQQPVGRRIPPLRCDHASSPDL
jgi:hypothetical protein